MSKETEKDMKLPKGESVLAYSVYAVITASMLVQLRVLV